MIYITRKEHFNAAHKLFNEAWSDEKNDIVFGKCANKNWHGHNYDLFVTVKGNVNPDTGFVVNLKDLAAGRLWAFNAMTSWSSKTGIYAVGPGSYTTQLVEIFDPVFRGKDNTGRSVSRSLYKDLVKKEKYLVT